MYLVPDLIFVNCFLVTLLTLCLHSAYNHQHLQQGFFSGLLWGIILQYLAPTDCRTLV